MNISLGVAKSYLQAYVDFILASEKLDAARREVLESGGSQEDLQMARDLIDRARRPVEFSQEEADAAS